MSTKEQKEAAKKSFTHARLMERLSQYQKSAVVRCRMLTPLAGGVPAGDKDLRAFIQYWLKIDPETDAENFEAALRRIRDEEIGERDTSPENGELKTEEVYQVNVIRRSEHGPFILDHMVKAMLKVGGSRLGIFKKKHGTKGDMVEMGMVRAHGESLQNPERPWEIYLRKNGGPAPTSFKAISGMVGGNKSIMHHTELADEGAVFEYRFAWADFVLKPTNVVDIIATTNVIGIGSVLSLGYGKLEAEILEID